MSRFARELTEWPSKVVCLFVCLGFYLFVLVLDYSCLILDAWNKLKELVGSRAQKVEEALRTPGYL